MSGKAGSHGKVQPESTLPPCPTHPQPLPYSQLVHPLNKPPKPQDGPPKAPRPGGSVPKARLTREFLQRKRAEHEAIRQEIETLEAEQNTEPD
ncbi:hypothetical protein SAMN05444515_108114 [Ectothiorhodospira marina]|uniref:Uncharacterized protein n=1 Tax=Ectothiorhodospira marina TaxID=1396821 RepID=A0A1H7M2F4_9GAMM|nr:hypothetical protein SAMN05444515_108114 [Ectothiorhodospira marina]